MKRGGKNSEIFNSINLILAVLLIAELIVLADNSSMTGNPVRMSVKEVVGGGGSSANSISKPGVVESKGIGMANPAAVYCADLGYEIKKVRRGDGGEYGICIFPDKTECEEWEFLEGKCGQKFSYCAKNGYDIITVKDGKNPFSKEYAICVSKNKKEDKIGSVTTLAGLGAKSIKSSSQTVKNLVKVDTSTSTKISATNPYPDYFDWRDNNGNWITPVKNQEQCGSCWAFAAVGVAEAAYDRAQVDPDTDLDLSEQNLIGKPGDDHLCLDGGFLNREKNNCGGGFAVSALSYIKDYGIVDENCFPYLGRNSGCEMCGWYYERRHSLTEVGGQGTSIIFMDLVLRGPFAANMGIDSGGTDEVGGHFDENGIYRCNKGGINHVVVVVGYNITGQYWIVKNSWGDWWNEDGYFKLGFNECDLGDPAFAKRDKVITNQDIDLEALYVYDVFNKEVSPNQQLLIRLGIRNIGEDLPIYTLYTPSKATFQAFYSYDPQIPGHLIDKGTSDFSVTYTGYGEYVDFSWQVPNHDQGVITINAFADSPGQFIESNESNNKKTINLTIVRCGDGICNGDEDCTTCAKECPCGFCRFDLECNDFNMCTTDTCDKPGQIDSKCLHTPLPQCVRCYSKSECNDNKDCTTDTCVNPGKLNSYCLNQVNIPNDCSANSKCGWSPSGCWSCGICAQGFYCDNGVCASAKDPCLIIINGQKINKCNPKNAPKLQQK